MLAPQGARSRGPRILFESQADETFGLAGIHQCCRAEAVPDSPGASLSARPRARKGISLEAFWISLAVIFVAELGDKSQLMAMTFATRFKPWPVLIGITVATAIVHLVSVAVGGLVGDFLPTTAITIVAGIAFLGFAIWTLRGDELTDEEAEKAQRTTRSAIIAVGVAFFLAELGDKTMLATITLATQHGWLGTWIGSTVGMVAADALAIVVGRMLGKHLPEKVIRYGAAAAFAVFGIILLVEPLVA
ncbi:Putative Ca2+/H+ antiporter, TMEM165/GDT1 family [Streptosporangium subroseum]|uniref:GDT1 family protein n=1 Tax=Streptosporangium subroseum TaxID=106412 RepID=A0A239M088_9ACTN|nr:Putative Ca2+/H+ antiporter, TMEM165/GDT1 family [Streptosporangium subroseum]